MNRFYLSKNYREINSAGNKAKTDIERILKESDYKNAGLRQTRFSNRIIGFLITSAGVLKVLFTVSKNDIVVLQYPFKKYYTPVCRMIRYKGGKVITIIHDLGSFRRKKLTIQKEIKRLNGSDVLIVHNERMKEWLFEQGFEKPMVCLEIFDYLSPVVASVKDCGKDTYTVTYAGSLSYGKNSFPYRSDDVISDWRMVLYGNGLAKEHFKNNNSFMYHGFVESDKLITNIEGDFGLVWGGESATTCSGSFGEYLRYNNPHKLSLYIRCNLPVIVWGKAALASFVSANNVGICVDSIEELSKILPSVSKDDYMAMKENTRVISDRLSAGYYTRKALITAENILKNNSQMPH